MIYKNKISITLLLTFLSSSVFCQNNSCQQNQSHPGYKTVIQETSSETLIREYILYIPENYNEAKPSALLINLHGFGGCALDYYNNIGDYYDFNSLADKENIIVAYPQGAYRPEKEDHYWEPGDNGEDNIYENDVYFIDQMINQISSEFNIAPDKIFSCGYSNGGMMTYSLACNRSELFSAVGIMSGTMLEEECNIDQPVPMIVFHGIADGVLPYEGSPWYQSVADVISFWLGKNNIPLNSLSTTSLNNGDVIKDEYNGGDENSCLTLYTIYEEFDKPGDHVWFSEKINDISPNDILWNFLNNNCSIINSIQQEFEEEKEIIVSPNPFSSQILIESNFDKNERFNVYNTHGVKVFSGQLNSDTQLIDLSAQPSSIYILSIADQKILITKTD